MKTILSHVVIGALVILCGVAASAQGYPRKPIRLLVISPAGGSADGSARSVATSMAKMMGTHIVIENRGGASGVVAAQILARAPADGYTLLWGTPSVVTASRILDKDLLEGAPAYFAPIGLGFTYCNALVTRNDSPLISINRLIAMATEKPGSLSYGTLGIGTAGHRSGALLQSMTGVALLHVPYKGGNEVIAAIVGGEVQLGFVSAATARTLRSRTKVLAVTSLNRDPSLPDVPSMDEAGIKGFEMIQGFGLLAPAGTPTAIINRLNMYLRAALGDEEVTRIWRDQGLNPAPSAPQEFATLINADDLQRKMILGDTQGAVQSRDAQR